MKEIMIIKNPTKYEKVVTLIICFSGINSHLKKWRIIIKNCKKTRIIP